MTVSFNPSLARTDASYRAEALKLYEQGKLEISDNDLKWLKEITAESSDDNQYDIEDYDLPQKDLSKDEKRTKTNLFGAIGGLFASGGAGLIAGLSGGAGKLACFSVNPLANAVTSASAPDIFAKASGMNAAAIVGSITSFAIGTKYMIQRPNKDLHDELMDLQDAMETGNLDIVNAKYQVEDAQKNINALSDESGNIQENANSEIEAKQKLIEEKQKRLEELQQKSQSPEGLTQSEYAEYNTLSGEIQALRTEIETLKTNAVSNVEANQDEIQGNQEVVNNANVTFETVDDVAKYAESFDEATLKLTKMEAAAQAVNAALGTAAALALTFRSPLVALTVFGQVCRALGIAGAGMSLYGMGEQIKFGNDIDDEIKVRENLQANNAVFNDATLNTEAAISSGIDAGNASIGVLEASAGSTPETTTGPEITPTAPETPAPEVPEEEKKPEEEQ